MAGQSSQQSRSYNNGYLTNGVVTPAPSMSGGVVPGAAPLLQNSGRVFQAGPTRVLCVADVRGNLSSLNDLAKSARADCIIHTGDFGFYDERSLDRIAEKTLKHVAQYSPLITEEVRRQVTTSQSGISLKDRIPRNQFSLSQLPLFLNDSLRFEVPVYTVWGACEDVQVLEKLRSGDYKIEKLHIIDEGHSHLLDVGGVKLRLLGLGGAVVMHKLFDNGEGKTTIAGGQGTMWTTLLQMGELVDTANRDHDSTETRVLVTHASPAREGLLNQLAVTLKVDFSISAGLHFRYGSSYNEFSVNPTLDHYRGKLAASKASFHDVWETVKAEVEPAVAENEAQQRSLQNAIDIVGKMPSVANGGNPFGGHVGPTTGQIDEMAFKNMWNFNLADAAYGWLVLEIEGGRIGTEMKAQGFNFAHRSMKGSSVQADMLNVLTQSANITGPTAANGAPPHPQAHTRLVKPAAAPAAQQSSGGQSRQPQTTRTPSTQHTPAARTAQPNSSTAPEPPQQNSQLLPTKDTVPKTTRPVGSAATLPNNQAGKSTNSQAFTDASIPSVNVNSTAALLPNGVAEKLPDSESKANGITPDRALDELSSSKDSSRPEPPKPSTGIFVQNVNSEEEARNVFSEADRKKIQRMQRIGKHWVAMFSTAEERDMILKEAPAELKRSTLGKPNIKVFYDRSGGPPRQYQGAGNWGSSRGGAAQQGGGTQQSGSRSGASDSEGVKAGRGGSYRGRGRGDRGSGRGGRGSFRGASASDGGSAPSTTPASVTAALPVSGDGK